MKKNKFDFNQKKMTVFHKFINFLNEVTDEVKDIESLTDMDETGSGEVALTYAVTDETAIEVKADGVAYGTDGAALTDGEYALLDGSLLVVKEGKFAGTKLAEETSNPSVEEAPIAQEGNEEEEVPTTEEPNNEEEEVVEVVAEEETTEEEVPAVEEETPNNEEEEVTEETELVPFMIGEVEYMLPQEVVDYINSLSATSETFRKEIVQMKERIPSTKPTTTVPVKQSKEEEKGNLYSRVNMFRL